MKIRFHDRDDQFQIYDETMILIDLRNLAYRIDEALRLATIDVPNMDIVVLRHQYLSPYRVRYI